MNNDLEQLLRSDLLSVPDDFSDRVMRNIQYLPLPTKRPGWREHLQWLAMGGAMIFGVMEVFAFMFGIWTAASVY